MRARGAAATFVVLVLGTAGCGNIAERATESALGAMSDGDVDLDLEGGGMSIEGPDGESLSFGASSDVPDAITDVVDLPAGFEAISTVEHRDADGMNGVTVSGSISTSDPAGVMAAIEEQLTGDGWEQVSQLNHSDQLITANYERGEENLTAQLMVDGDEGGLSFILLRPS